MTISDSVTTWQDIVSKTEIKGQTYLRQCVINAIYLSSTYTYLMVGVSVGVESNISVLLVSSVTYTMLQCIFVYTSTSPMYGPLKV